MSKLNSDDEINIISDDDNSIHSQNENNDNHDNTILNNLLKELKIISDIKEYDKISIHKSLLIDKPYFLQSFFRTYNGDGRLKTISYIELLLKNIYEIIDDFIAQYENKNENKTEPKKRTYYDISKSSMFYSDKYYQFNKNALDVLKRCREHLINSISGIQNLKITYINDISTTSKLDMLIVNIQNRCTKINNLTNLTN
jgi:hypothetical protein